MGFIMKTLLSPSSSLWSRRADANQPPTTPPHLLETVKKCRKTLETTEKCGKMPKKTLETSEFARNSWIFAKFLPQVSNSILKTRDQTLFVTICCQREV